MTCERSAASTTPCPSSSSSNYLAIPANRIARSSSHESFATDVSLLSLSSFASDWPSRRRGDKDDDQEPDQIDYLLARYREDMLEKMLETHSVRISPSGSALDAGRWRHAKLDRRTGQFLDEELLLAAELGGFRMRWPLCKSFSSSDVTNSDTCPLLRYPFDALDELKTCASQLRMNADQHPPSTSVSATGQSNPRKRLEYFKRSSGDDWHQQYSNCNTDRETPTECDESNAGTPDTAGPFLPKWRHSTTVGSIKTALNAKIGGRKPPIDDASCRRANSDENILDGHRGRNRAFLKKLRFSKEIGRRIRDDLMEKLGKKQKLVTKIDLERETGRPLTKMERNFMIFHWLQSLDDDSFADL